MDTSEVEVAFRRHICNVRRNVEFLAVLPYSCRCVWIVDGCENHSDVFLGLEVDRQEDTIDMLNLSVFNPVGNLAIQPITRANNRDSCVRIQEIQDPAGSYLP
jgi:hypothetical protein